MTGRGGGSRGTGQTFPKQCSRPVRKPASLAKGNPQLPSGQYSLLAPQTHQQMSPGLPSMELGGLGRTPHPSLSSGVGPYCAPPSWSTALLPTLSCPSGCNHHSLTNLP